MTTKISHFKKKLHIKFFKKKVTYDNDKKKITHDIDHKHDIHEKGRKIFSEKDNIHDLIHKYKMVKSGWLKCSSSRVSRGCCDLQQTLGPLITE